MIYAKTLITTPQMSATATTVSTQTTAMENNFPNANTSSYELETLSDRSDISSPHAADMDDVRDGNVTPAHPSKNTHIPGTPESGTEQGITNRSDKSFSDRDDSLVKIKTPKQGVTVTNGIDLDTARGVHLGGADRTTKPGTPSDAENTQTQNLVSMTHTNIEEMATLNDSIDRSITFPKIKTMAANGDQHIDFPTPGQGARVFNFVEAPLPQRAPRGHSVESSRAGVDNLKNGPSDIHTHNSDPTRDTIKGEQNPNIESIVDTVLQNLTKNHDLGKQFVWALSKGCPDLLKIIDRDASRMQGDSAANAFPALETNDTVNDKKTDRLNHAQTLSNKTEQQTKAGTKSQSPVFQNTRLQMPQAAENQWRLARRSLVLGAKSDAWSQHLMELNDKRTVSTWSTGESDLPLFIRCLPRMEETVAEIRIEAAIAIQEAAAMKLREKANMDKTNGAAMLAAVEPLLENSTGETCSFELAKDKLYNLVGQQKAFLKNQLDKRVNHLVDIQHSQEDFAKIKSMFPGQFDPKEQKSKTLTNIAGETEEVNGDHDLFEVDTDMDGNDDNINSIDTNQKVTGLSNPNPNQRAQNTQPKPPQTSNNQKTPNTQELGIKPDQGTFQAPKGWKIPKTNPKNQTNRPNPNTRQPPSKGNPRKGTQGQNPNPNRGNNRGAQGPNQNHNRANNQGFAPGISPNYKGKNPIPNFVYDPNMVRDQTNRPQGGQNNQGRYNNQGTQPQKGFQNPRRPTGNTPSDKPGAWTKVQHKRKRSISEDQICPPKSQKNQNHPGEGGGLVLTDREMQILAALRS